MKFAYLCSYLISTLARLNVKDFAHVCQPRGVWEEGANDEIEQLRTLAVYMQASCRALLASTPGREQ